MFFDHADLGQCLSRRFCILSPWHGQVVILFDNAQSVSDEVTTGGFKRYLLLWSDRLTRDEARIARRFDETGVAKRACPSVTSRKCCADAMNRRLLLTAFLPFIAILLSIIAANASNMVVQSLSGAVTSTEISSYKNYMAGVTPPTTNTYNNNMADGTAGLDCESLGLMYEVSHDTQILNQMIQFADAFLSLRNDFTDKRVMWDGQVDPVWLTKPATNSEAGYAGCENNDIAGHIAYCAKLILQTPSIWTATVPVGDPHGYGATYLQRAQTYITQMEGTQNAYMLPNFIAPVTYRITAPTNAAWTAFGESVNAWNRQFMFMNGFQRLSECHALLGDNPAKVTRYDAIVQASVSWFQSEWQTAITNGQTCYIWQYAPGHTGGNEELNLHAAYDLWGLDRAYAAGKYGLTQTLMRPFAETLRYIIYQGTNTFAEWVNGNTSKTRNYIYPEWMGIAAYDPCTFAIMADADIAQGSQASNPIFDAFILWLKNNRALGVYAGDCDAADFSLTIPWAQMVTAGSNATYTVSVNSLDGFSGNVALTASNLPAGAIASFSPASVAGSGTSTLTIATTNALAPGSYSPAILGTSASTTRSASITLNIPVDSDDDGIPDGWMWTYFGHPTGQASDNSLATNDADGDGMSNLAEYLCGTNPTNASSYLHFTSAQPTNNGVALAWTDVGGKSYVVQATNGPTNTFADISPIITALGSGESVTNYFDPNTPTNSSTRFYRIRLGP